MSSLSPQRNPSSPKKTPPHLSEFYNYLNSNAEEHSQTRRSSVPTLNSALTENTVDSEYGARYLSSNDKENTIECYKSLLQKSIEYKRALIQLSHASSGFGAALEDCARCKGVGPPSEGLMKSAGLHHLISNQHVIISKQLDKNFEKPLESLIEQFSLKEGDLTIRYKALLKEKVKILRYHERETIKLSKRKSKKIAAYKANLDALQGAVDVIDKLNQDYNFESSDLVQSTSDHLLELTAALLKAEIEIYENVAKKGWSGGGLEDLVSRYPDPFDEIPSIVYSSPVSQSSKRQSIFGDNDITETSMHSQETLTRNEPPRESNAEHVEDEDEDEEEEDESFSLPIPEQSSKNEWGSNSPD